MTWHKSRADRQRDNDTYGSAEYKRNRAVALRRAGGRCEQCGHRHPRLECDHIIPKSQGGGNTLENLRMVCTGAGSCQCHDKKTFGEGSGYRRPKSASDPQPRPRTRW